MGRIIYFLAQNVFHEFIFTVLPRSFMYNLSKMSTFSTKYIHLGDK